VDVEEPQSDKREDHQRQHEKNQGLPVAVGAARAAPMDRAAADGEWAGRRLKRRVQKERSVLGHWR